jgi:hypothetical protein
LRERRQEIARRRDVDEGLIFAELCNCELELGPPLLEFADAALDQQWIDSGLDGGDLRVNAPVCVRQFALETLPLPLMARVDLSL